MIKAMIDYLILILLTLYSLVFIIASTLMMIQGVGGRSDWKKVAIGFGIFLFYYISFPLVKEIFKKRFKRIRNRIKEKDDSDGPGYEEQTKSQEN